MIENKENLTPGQITALEQFRDQAIPFLANECLINGTYLLFNSGKRDFANILHQVHEIVTPGKKEFNNGSELGDTKLAAAIMTVALSDTRRSEMTHVLNRQELLNSVPDHLIEPLEKVLRMTGLLNEGEHINDLRDRNDTQKLRDIEGFLLRVGQNIRMTTELAGVFKKPGASDRLSILEQGRVAPARVSRRR